MILKICDKCGKIIGDDEYHKCLHSDSNIARQQDTFYFCGDCFSAMIERRSEVRDQFVKDTDNV